MSTDEIPPSLCAAGSCVCLSDNARKRGREGVRVKREKRSKRGGERASNCFKPVSMFFPGPFSHTPSTLVVHLIATDVDTNSAQTTPLFFYQIFCVSR